ncbi:hypothetical protein RchiOBHm_Chr1g0342031 [Rosa chinensis]|uniref:Uncharacterized protein n=1 Tax=Rosa chinensis TaxID=74649 RepID=A0A2P6SDW2_ROSCH|nr:hypothetical protein RchiOBHm_Chr1g0342031 [Rosa chinensis]
MNPKPYHGYFGQYMQVFACWRALDLKMPPTMTLRNFTELMWPNGHDQFC